MEQVYEMQNAPSVTEYVHALTALGKRVTDEHRNLFRVHYQAPARTATAKQIASWAGISSHSVVNLRYGKLGHAVCNELGIEPGLRPDHTNRWWSVWSRGWNTSDGFVWQMLPNVAEALEQLGWVNPDIETDIDAIRNNTAITETERRELIKCRIGQGTFRQKLIAYWKACAVTGYKDTGLLVASHIKPWRICTNTERLNPFNGLLLTPNLDRVFDAGLITFLANGFICLSPLLSNPGQLGIESDMRIVLASQHAPFMDFHRTLVFRSK